MEHDDRLTEMLDQMLLEGLNSFMDGSGAAKLSEWMTALGTSPDENVKALVSAMGVLRNWIIAGDTSNVSGLNTALTGLANATKTLADAEPEPQPGQRPRKRRLTDLGNLLNSYTRVGL